MASTLDAFRGGAVGFIDWLDATIMVELGAGAGSGEALVLL
jgi:hypothetical protein